ncbi:MAG TPA: hypothetical protein VKE96_12375 [Vicinamibacterales bacterium]|nr:hypothetical protein [Vicinamibacterales bacterium]
MAYTPLTPEQKAKLTPADLEAQIADLEAALADLRTPVPQEYPKWTEIGGVSQIVESEEDEKRKKAAHDKHEKAEHDKSLKETKIGTAHASAKG